MIACQFLPAIACFLNGLVRVRVFQFASFPVWQGEVWCFEGLGLLKVLIFASSRQCAFRREGSKLFVLAMVDRADGKHANAHGVSTFI